MKKFKDEQLVELKTKEEKLRDIDQQIRMKEYRKFMLEHESQIEIRRLKREIADLEIEREKINGGSV